VPNLPSHLFQNEVIEHNLSPLEETYFKKYGGTARKAGYGPMGITIVRTTSPLRHLHSPEECLRGLGFDVAFKGTANGIWPSAIYTASNHAGRWNVNVTFAANDGFVTSNMSAVIWHWLKAPTLVWTSYQRITPENLEPEIHHRLETSFMAALDVPRNLIGEVK
jgi:hypothetical protein